MSCPPPSAAFETFKDELAEYKMTRPAVQLPKSKLLPLGLIGRMAKVPAKANVEREPKKTK